MKKFLRALSCLVLVLSCAAGARAKEPEKVGMYVAVDGGERTPYAYGAVLDVCLGSTVELEPNTADAPLTSYIWADRTYNRKRKIVFNKTRDTKFSCTIQKTNTDDRIALVTFRVVPAPVLAVITDVPDVSPGTSVAYRAVPDVSALPERYGTARRVFEWTLFDAGGAVLDKAEPLPSATEEPGDTLTLAVPRDESAWRLNGVTARCRVSFEEYPLVGAAASSDEGLRIGLAADPPEGEIVPVPVDDPGLPVTVALNAVFGGDAASEDLKYRWQKKNGETWNDLAGATGFSHTFMLPEEGGDYRCVVESAGGDRTARSGVFEARKVDHALVVGPRATPDPAILVSDGRGSVTATGTIEKPANRQSGSTEYVYEALRREGDGLWSVVSRDGRSTVHRPGDAFSLTFEVPPGLHVHRLRATSRVAPGVRGESGPFAVLHVDRSRTGVRGSSVPEAEGGVVPVRSGQAIEYVLTATGGSGRWRVEWFRDGERIEGARGMRYADPAPRHGARVRATAAATLPGRGGGKPVPGLEPYAVSFDPPFVALEWDPEPSGGTIGVAELSGGDGAFTALRAKGGRGEYVYGWRLDGDPGGWREAPEGAFAAAAALSGHDFSDGRSAEFVFRFRAGDGEQTVLSGPVRLRVVAEPSLQIDGAEWCGGKYAVEYPGGSPPTLSARVVGGNFDFDGDDGVEVLWTPSGEETERGRFWTPPEDRRGEYGVAVAALDGLGNRIAETELSVRVREPVPAVRARGRLDPARAAPGEPVRLTVGILGHGSGRYAFEAGPAGGEAEPAGGGDRAVWDFEAPSAAGTHAYRWRVADLETGLSDAGLEILTVVPPDAPLFRILPEKGARFVAGSAFDMEVIGAAASGLTWRSRTPAAAVGDPGRVFVLAAGEAEIEAALKSDPARTAAFAFTATERVEYRILVPSLVFRTGESVDVAFETVPEGGTFACAPLPGDLRLSAGGRLRGTAPAPGSYLPGPVTATWPDGHVETRGVSITVTGDGAAPDENENGGGDENGGCRVCGPLPLLLPGWFAFRKRSGESRNASGFFTVTPP